LSGIGRTTAVALAGAGWSVTLTGRRREALEETAKLCGSDSDERCLIVAGNITNEEFVERLFEDTIRRFGTSTLLVSLGIELCEPGNSAGRLDLLFNVSILFSILGQL